MRRSPGSQRIHGAPSMSSEDRSGALQAVLRGQMGPSPGPVGTDKALSRIQILWGQMGCSPGPLRTDGTLQVLWGRRRVSCRVPRPGQTTWCQTQQLQRLVGRAAAGLVWNVCGVRSVAASGPWLCEMNRLPVRAERRRARFSGKHSMSAAWVWTRTGCRPLCEPDEPLSLRLSVSRPRQLAAVTKLGPRGSLCACVFVLTPVLWYMCVCARVTLRDSVSTAREVQSLVSSVPPDPAF